MIHEQKLQIPSSVKIIKHKIAKCIKCGNDDIKIEEYEDRYGFISTASCKKCKNEVKRNTTEVGIIKEWNNQNDISILIKNKKKLILQTTSEIKKLMKLKNIRNKKLSAK